MGGGFATWLVAGALVFAVVGMGFAFAGGAVIVAIPLAVFVVLCIGLLDVMRRRGQAQKVTEHREEAKADKAEFTERDQQSLVSE
jgi:hypothetical protein